MHLLTKFQMMKFNVSVSDQLYPETLLPEIRGKCLSYSSYAKKKKNNEKEKSFINLIKQLEEKYEENVQTINLKKKVVC